MAKGPPRKITIAHDDYHAEHVGKTADGRQFFLTTPFVPAARGKPGAEYIALYVFHRSGELVDATIDALGPRSKLDHAARRARRDELLASLGKYEHGAIKVAPFKIERFGVEFGLIVQPPEERGGEWSVIAEPGNFMCFWPPWNGDYDT